MNDLHSEMETIRDAIETIVRDEEDALLGGAFQKLMDAAILALKEAERLV